MTRPIRYQNEKGITLIALAITIIIILILAAITFNATLGENGIIKRAMELQNIIDASIEQEQEELNKLAEHIDEMVGNTRPGEEEELPFIDMLTDIQDETVQAQDRLGNGVVVPGGFKFATEDSGTTVKDGIVIEDEDGNQFVWIAVSNVDGGADPSYNIPVKIDENTEVEITLGRYSDFEMDATARTSAMVSTPTPVQLGSDYNLSVGIDSIKEVKTEERTDGRLGAKNLEAFVESVKINHGYYLARYEASYGSGGQYGEGDDTAESIKYYRPLSQQSTQYTSTSGCGASSSDRRNEMGFLWNWVSQKEAALASRQMYYGSAFVESDLVNSYAWDTAVIYIQAMGNTNYGKKIDNKGFMQNTGDDPTDEVCHIVDMGGNLVEYSTESGGQNGFVARGGCYDKICTSIPKVADSISGGLTESAIYLRL